MQLEAKIKEDEMLLGLPPVVVVYCEDGSLADSAFFTNRWAKKTFGNFTYVEMKNTYGYSQDKKVFTSYINKYASLEKPIVIFTSLVYVMSWVEWNDYVGGFPIYICKDSVVKNVQAFTDKELRTGHNIEKIYRNGGFDE